MLRDDGQRQNLVSNSSCLSTGDSLGAKPTHPSCHLVAGTRLGRLLSAHLVLNVGRQALAQGYLQFVRVQEFRLPRGERRRIQIQVVVPRDSPGLSPRRQLHQRAINNLAVNRQQPGKDTDGRTAYVIRALKPYCRSTAAESGP